MVTKKKKSAPKKAASAKTPMGFKRILMWVATLFVWGGIALGVVLAFYAYDLPDVDEAMTVERRPGLTLLSAGGQVIATSGDLYGEAIQVGELPDYLPQAVMATEDRRFYSHFGVDFIGLARAMVTNIAAGKCAKGDQHSPSKSPRTCF